MLYLRCFIDDGFGVWLHDPDPLIEESSGLKWIFSERLNEVVFMDVWLKIEEKNVVTSVYAKPMALHLYIPSHSCHVPGLFPGIVFGNVLQIHKLCTRAVGVT